MILLEKKINGKTFRLIKNSIIEEKVDAIINPANEYLAHGGGVAGLISEAGGPEIQKESDQKAPIKTGSATYTNAGSLPFKYILHTVGPIWKGGNQNETQLLESAVSSVLHLANKLQLKSISMPSISTGIFGYPLAPAIKTIINSIFDFLKEDSTIEEVRLCEFSENKADEIKEIIDQTIQP